MPRLELKARTALDGSGFAAGTRKMESVANATAKRIGTAFKTQIAAAFGTAAITAALRGSVKLGSELSDMADRMGISAERLQELSFAAGQGGNKLEEFQSIMAALARNRLIALKNSASDAAAGFKTLGISMEELRSIRLDDLLFKISAAFKDAEDPQQLMTAALLTMGDAGLKVLPTLKLGLQEMADEARKLGQVIEESLIQRLDQAADTTEKVMGRMRATFATVVGTGFKLFDRMGEQIARLIAIRGVARAAGNLKSELPPALRPVVDALSTAAKLGVATAPLEPPPKRQRLTTDFGAEADAILKEQERKRSEAEADREQAKTARERVTKAETEPKPTEFQAPNVNELQRIGAFAVNPQEATLRKMEMAIQLQRQELDLQRQQLRVAMDTWRAIKDGTLL